MNSLKNDKISIAALSEYADFANIFSPDLAFKLPEHTKINNNAINLINIKQLFYGSFYTLELVEPKILKIYIKTNLAYNF